MIQILRTKKLLKSDQGRHIALIATDYPPLRTSAAVQMHDLAVEMVRLGHRSVVIVPTAGLACGWVEEVVDGVTLLRIRAPNMRDTSYITRTIREGLLPFMMLYGIRKSPYANAVWDLIVWYSPTIFFGPLIWLLRRSSGCRTYLILRDLFPEWAVDLGLMSRGLVYTFFKGVANVQYAAASTIGVQSKSNLVYMDLWRRRWGKRIEILHNWQTPMPNIGCSINLGATSLAGRKIVVYIGNMGVAQGMDILIDLAESLMPRDDVGFLFVGRGSEMGRLKERVNFKRLSNTLFFDEIDSREMPGLLSQCYVGLISLDTRHNTHNIPGKFLTYLLSGIPVLARVNKSTDLMQLINGERVGLALCSLKADPLKEFLESIISDTVEYQVMSQNGRELAKKLFSSTSAANQIIASIVD